MTAQIAIGGYVQASNAGQMLDIAREQDAQLFSLLDGHRIEPVLGSVGGTYQLLADFGVLAFPAGVLASYLASVLFSYFRRKPDAENRLQVTLTLDSAPIIIFVDRQSDMAEIEAEIRDLLAQPDGQHDRNQ